MSQGEKSAYYRALKDAGYVFDKHYRDYKASELKEGWATHAKAHGLPEEIDVPAPKSKLPEPRADELAELREQLSAVNQTVQQLAELVTTNQRRQEQAFPHRSVKQPEPDVKPEPMAAKPTALDPNQHAGATMNTHEEGEEIEIDQHGNKWYQKEVRKPAFPKPRGRRILKYDDPGVRTEKIKVGDYIEEFEVAGDAKNLRPSEIKITLPSYQTGIFKPPNMPFKVHTYQGVRGFNLFDVQKYYGGADLVPSEIKRMYVSTDLCYDITTTIRAIENEYRERVLRAEKRIA